MIAATLFSGIGAPETAMPKWDWPWHAEIEKFPVAVMADRHPKSENLGDVSAYDFAKRAAVVCPPDVIVFGSPCQSYSIAGKRLGLDDPRGNLALIALGIVAGLKPDWFVFENVPGLLSSSEGRDFGLFLRTVDEFGYSGAWASLDAQYRGLAQRRERLFFVGHSGDWRGPAAVLFEPEGLCGHSPPSRQSGQRIGPTLAARASAGGGLGTDADCDGALIASHDVAQPLLAKANSSHRADAESYVAHSLRADGFDASEDGTGRGTPLIVGAMPAAGGTEFKHGHGWGQQEWESGYIVPTLRSGVGNGPGNRARSGDGKDSAIIPVAVDLRNGAEGEVFQTLQSHHSLNAEPTLRIGSAVRRLTPRECERLQGFPDDYTLIEYRGKPAADGPRYKALGNSMAVPVMHWILSRIERLS